MNSVTPWLLTEGLDRLGQLRGKIQGLAGAPVGLHGGAGTIGGER